MLTVSVIMFCTRLPFPWRYLDVLDVLSIPSLFFRHSVDSSGCLDASLILDDMLGGPPPLPEPDACAPSLRHLPALLGLGEAVVHFLAELDEALCGFLAL